MGDTRLNVEVKARCADLDAARQVLVEAGAVSHGADRQTDTYFETVSGRLKVREGNIENALIAYDRPDAAGARASDVRLAVLDPGRAAAVRAALESVLPVAASVVKAREILFIGNVKFHLDRVEGLGTFVEIEAISEAGRPSRETLERQAAEWSERLGLEARDTVAGSYKEMVKAPGETPAS